MFHVVVGATTELSTSLAALPHSSAMEVPFDNLSKLETF